MSSGTPSNVRHACKQQRICFNENIETIPAGLEEFSTMLGVSRSQGLGISQTFLASPLFCKMEYWHGWKRTWLLPFFVEFEVNKQNCRIYAPKAANYLKNSFFTTKQLQWGAVFGGISSLALFLWTIMNYHDGFFDPCCSMKIAWMVTNFYEIVPLEI